MTHVSQDSSQTPHAFFRHMPCGGHCAKRWETQPWSSQPLGPQPPPRGRAHGRNPARVDTGRTRVSGIPACTASSLWSRRALCVMRMPPWTAFMLGPLRKSSSGSWWFLSGLRPGDGPGRPSQVGWEASPAARVLSQFSWCPQGLAHGEDSTHSFIHLFIHSVNMYLLSEYHVPNSGDRAISEQDRWRPCLPGASYILGAAHIQEPI